MTDEPKRGRKIRAWIVDPSVFEPLTRAGFLERHITGQVKSLGKYALYSLGFAYPVLLVSLGIVLGGFVFWASFVGSLALIWLIINRAGYSRNFDNWDMGWGRFIGLIGAFGMALSILGLLILVSRWAFPIVGGVLILSLVAVLLKASRR